MARRAVTGRPRVAHFSVAPEFVDRIMLHDLRRLREHEDITVISTEGPSLASVRAEGFRVHTVAANRKISPLADLRTLWSLWRLFRREKFDLLHSYTPKAGLLGQTAGAMALIPRRLHGCRGLLYSSTASRLRVLLFTLTDWLTGHLAHRTLFLSGADLRYAVSHRLCAPERAVMLGSGIDLAHFTATPELRERAAAWRRELGISPAHRLVLTVGRYVADKGYEEIARAAAMTRKAHPDVRYVWVAPVFAGEDGVLPDDLPNRFGVGDLVHRVGYIDDMAPVLLAADLLAHASHREGVPRALMEAAAMGLPIVATDIPGCREVVNDDETALLFSPHAPESLASALDRALTDWPATSRRAQRALEDVRARFDQDSLSRRVWAEHSALLEAPAT